MKRALLPILLALPVVYAGGCSAEDKPITVPPVAGTPGTGGTPGAGGTPGMGGNGPMAGTSPGGGSGGKGGMGGTGGTGTGGIMGGSGGSGGSSGGSGGSAGSGGSGEVQVTIDGLDGMLLETPCATEQSTDDCLGSMRYKGMTYECVNERLDSDSQAGLLDFPVTGGVPGQTYKATLHFYGVMEPKAYGPNATREAGNQRPTSTEIPDTPEPYATADGDADIAETEYNNWEVHTYNQAGERMKQYFLNSDTQQGHYTFAISYAREIEVVSGGKVHVRTYDSNCRMIKNCEGNDWPCAGKARVVPLTGADPMPPASFMQPGLGLSDAHSGQWLFIDVKGIVAM